MAEPTQDASAQPEEARNPHPTPMTSYLGIAIIAAIAVGMIVLAMRGRPGF